MFCVKCHSKILSVIVKKLILFDRLETTSLIVIICDIKSIIQPPTTKNWISSYLGIMIWIHLHLSAYVYNEIQTH